MPPTRRSKIPKIRLRYRAHTVPPGTFLPPEGSPESRIQLLAYDQDNLEEREIRSISELDEHLGKWPVTWIHVTGLGSAELLTQLAIRLNLHNLAMEDVASIPQRAKLELYPEYYFAIARIACWDSELSTEQISLFLSDQFVLTFQEREGPCFQSIVERIRTKSGRIRTQRQDYLTYCLFDSIINSYYPVLDRLNQQLEDLEEEIIFRPEAKSVTEIYELKRDLLLLRRSIWPLREVSAELVKDDFDRISKSTRNYFRDSHDHVFQVMDLIETYREISSGLMDVYLSRMSHRMNEIIKVLTIMASIFIPLTFISSIYGMNFNTKISAWNMPELNWTYGYPFVFGIMILVTLSLLTFFKVKKWV